MKIADAWKQITTTYCDTAVFAYENQHWTSRKGHVSLRRLDSDEAVSIHTARMRTDAANFVGIYRRDITFEQFQEDCIFIIGQGIGTDDGTSEPI